MAAAENTSFIVNAYSKDDLPTGFQRADGVETNYGSGGLPASLALIGTASIAGATVPIEETPDSPTLERAEQFTAVHRYTMSWTAAVAKLATLPRGTLYYAAVDGAHDPFVGDDGAASIFKVLSAKITHAPGNTAVLEITSEALNIDVPPDQFNISAIELGVNILKHPRYFYALYGMSRDTGVVALDTYKLNQQVIRALQQYFDNPSLTNRNAIADLISQALDQPGEVNRDGDVIPGVVGDVTYLTGTKFAKQAALEILQKYWLGIENPYIVGWQIVYTTYWWRPPALHPGGIIQEPYYTVDEQFLWKDFGEGVESVDDTIFWNMKNINPACYSSTGKAEAGAKTRISWLRKADTLTFERTFYRLESTWIGSPVGFWDKDIFRSGNAPAEARVGEGTDDYVPYVNLWLPPLPSRPTA